MRPAVSPGWSRHCHRYTAPEVQVPFTPPKPIAPTPEELRGSTVLVVDDERAWRGLLATHLKMVGYKVSISAGGDQALVLAQAAKPEGAVLGPTLSATMDGESRLNAVLA